MWGLDVYSTPLLYFSRYVSARRYPKTCIKPVDRLMEAVMEAAVIDRLMMEYRQQNKRNKEGIGR